MSTTEPGIEWLSRICTVTISLSHWPSRWLSYYEDIVPFHLVTREKILQILQDLCISFPTGHSLPVDSGYNSGMWNFEIQFLPLFFHQNVQFYNWRGGSSSFTFFWSSKLCVLSLPRALEAVLANLEGKKGSCPPWEAWSGISFAVPNQMFWNERGHIFSHGTWG